MTSTASTMAPLLVSAEVEMTAEAILARIAASGQSGQQGPHAQSVELEKPVRSLRTRQLITVRSDERVATSRTGAAEPSARLQALRTHMQTSTMALPMLRCSQR